MKLDQEKDVIGFLVKVSNLVGISAIVVTLLLVFVVLLEIIPASDQSAPEMSQRRPAQQQQPATAPADDMWRAPDLASVPQTPEGDQIRYGRELIAHTAQYLGPEGSVRFISNGMNCQNCHLDAGTKAFGNNYSLVASTYPKFRARSGTTEDVVKRVNDCFERSLNGQTLDTSSTEMKALVAYIEWVGKDVPKNEKVKGAGLPELPLLDRAASPEKGKAVYVQKCQSCHGQNGEGSKQADASEYQFPPLWGDHSYNTGAGLYRVSTFARYVKGNMPLGATHNNTILSDEEAWDLAAYVNSMPHPEKDISNDWPDIKAKPFDHPFGPFADSFSEEQHKYGPFKPIIEKSKK